MPQDIAVPGQTRPWGTGDGWRFGREGRLRWRQSGGVGRRQGRWHRRQACNDTLLRRCALDLFASARSPTRRSGRTRPAWLHAAGVKLGENPQGHGVDAPGAENLSQPASSTITGKADSPLAMASDLVLWTGDPPEVCLLGLAPTTSATAMGVIGDVLVVRAVHLGAFTKRDYALRHHGGYLGDVAKR